jgi:hypothetical protein
MSAVAVSTPRRELARRVSGELEVTLYWSCFDNSTSVEIWQHASDETFAFTVAPERALDAFYHPFAHAPTAFHDRRSAVEDGTA